VFLPPAARAACFQAEFSIHEKKRCTPPSLEAFLGFGQSGKLLLVWAYDDLLQADRLSILSCGMPGLGHKTE
jgi:hypothetical protein